MKIKTDDLGLEEPKNPKTCNVFNLYSLIASKDQTTELENKYRAGNYGYGHAKQELFELICDKFSKERKAFNYYMENKNILDEKLAIGAEKARVIAKKTLTRIRKVIGY